MEGETAGRVLEAGRESRLTVLGRRRETPFDGERDTGRAMSQENVELFLRIIDAANLPTDEIAGVLAPLLVPGLRMDNATTAVTDRTYYGVEGCLEWRADLAEGFAPGVRFEVEEILADAEDFVVGRQVLVGTGASSGAPLHLRWVTVMWFEDGRASRTVGYNTRREALEALGLEP
jgi:hypothetical protein